VVISTALDFWRRPALPEGSPLPTVTLQDGTTADLQAMSRDKPLLVYYWASWCGVCRFTTPTVEQLWQEGENVLTVALRSGSDEPLRTGMAKKGLTFPTHNDESGD
ncbi:redoxin family protein, partial [Klebsiella pneumoniae]